MVWFARRASCRAGPLACPVLWTVRVAEAPGSRAAAGRRAAIAERPLGLEGRPGNLRGANHTITDVTGRGKAAPGHRWAALWPPTPRGSAALPTSDGRKDRAGAPRVVGNPLRFRLSGRGVRV